MRKIMRWFATGFLGLVVASGASSCTEQRNQEEEEGEAVGSVRQALTTTQRVLEFEGPIGGAGGAPSDWVTSSGTISSSDNAFAGAHSLSVVNGWSPTLTSIPLSTFDAPMATSAGLEVWLPTSMQLSRAPRDERLSPSLIS